MSRTITAFNQVEENFNDTKVLKGLGPKIANEGIKINSTLTVDRCDEGKTPCDHVVFQDGRVIGITRKDFAVCPNDGKNLLNYSKDKLKVLVEKNEKGEVLSEEEEYEVTLLKDIIKTLSEKTETIVQMVSDTDTECVVHMTTGSDVSHLYVLTGEDGRLEEVFSHKWLISKEDFEEKLKKAQFSDMISSIVRFVEKKEKPQWEKMEDNDEDYEKVVHKLWDIRDILGEKLDDEKVRNSLPAKELKNTLGKVPLFLYADEWETQNGRVKAMIFGYICRLINVDFFWLRLCSGKNITITEVNVFEGKHDPKNENALVGTWGVWGDLSVLAYEYVNSEKGKESLLYKKTMKAIELGKEIACESVDDFFKNEGKNKLDKNLAEVCCRIASKLIMDELNKEEGEIPNDKIWVSLMKWKPSFCATDDLRPLIAKKRAEMHAEKRAEKHAAKRVVKRAEKRAAETSAEESPAKCSRVGSI